MPREALAVPPEGWRDGVARIEAVVIRLGAQREGAESAMRPLEDEIERIGADPAALGIAARVEAWRELRSRYDSAAYIPVRQGELAAKRDAVAGLLRRHDPRARPTDPGCRFRCELWARLKT